MAAETTVDNNQELKHLGFVKFAAIYAVATVSNLYDHVKTNSGPLKSTLGSAEGVVTSVVNPVCQKFKGLPTDLLVLADNKVDEGTRKFDKDAPPLAKRVVSKAGGIVQTTSEKAQALYHEAQVGGLGAAVHYAAAESKHLLLTQSVRIWILLDQFAPFHGVAEVAVPTAAKLSQKYNTVITDFAGKGYTLFNYVPLVPIDEISNEFKKGKAAKEEDAADTKDSRDSSSSSSDSD